MRSSTFSVIIFCLSTAICCWHIIRVTRAVASSRYTTSKRLRPNDLGEVVHAVPIRHQANPTQNNSNNKNTNKLHHFLSRSSSNTQQQQKHIPNPLLSRRKCNCNDSRCVDPRYCQRVILSIHKMGVTLVNTLQRKYFGPKLVPTTELVQHSKLGRLYKNKYQNPVVPDYRHVIVTRNWWQSLVSGYLYHRNHMECELDWFGKSNFTGWLLSEDWEERIADENVTWPAGRGRNLCDYLSQESEHDGLRVYTAWAKHMYLDPLLDFVQTRQGDEHTLFVCYEDLTSRYVETVQRMSDFWKRPPRVPIAPNDGQTDRDRRDKENLHAVKISREQKRRLMEHVQQLDRDLYNGTIRKGNDMLACGSATQRRVLL